MLLVTIFRIISSEQTHGRQCNDRSDDRSADDTLTRLFSIFFLGTTFQFLLFKRNIQNQTRIKGHPIQFFWRCETFFKNIVFKGSPLVISGVKHYIRTFDVMSEHIRYIAFW